jgi:cell division protein FtsQ
VSFWVLRDHVYFHVTAVRVYGAAHVSQQELMDQAQIPPGVSLWRIDAQHIRDRLLHHPWIKDVLVRRLFPNALELIVYERKPTAILANQVEYVIDVDGYVLGQGGPRESSSGLPRLLLRGDQTWTPGQHVADPGIRAALRILGQTQEQPLFHNIGLVDIEIVNPERFLLHTHRGKLVVGANLASIEDKLAFLPALDEALRTKIQHIDAIDLSFANQIVVKTSTRTPQGTGRLQKRGDGSGQTY